MWPTVISPGGGGGIVTLAIKLLLNFLFDTNEPINKEIKDNVYSDLEI